MSGGAPRPLAVSLGEPAGIGPELIAAAWHLRHDRQTPPFCLIAPPELFAAALPGTPPPLKAVETAAEALAVFLDALPVFPVDGPATVRAGHPAAATAESVIASIAGALALVRRGQASGLVTAPIQKSVLYEAGFGFPGHTEYLQDTARRDWPDSKLHNAIMMLCTDDLRVVPVTVHLPLRAVADQLKTDDIIRIARIAAEGLMRDFGIAAPRLAVAALNPHAGEGGTIGREEIDIIAPAVNALRDAGIAAAGPLPADTLFHEGARQRYDAVLCMYHDQALIPLKTLDFAGGVNVTLGLPFVRTSPDHGTALDIAGQGRADPTSFLAALHRAAAMARTRQAWSAAAEAGGGPGLNLP